MSHPHTAHDMRDNQTRACIHVSDTNHAEEASLSSSAIVQLNSILYPHWLILFTLNSVSCLGSSTLMFLLFLMRFSELILFNRNVYVQFNHSQEKASHLQFALNYGFNLIARKIMIGKKILNTIFHSFIVYWSVQEGGVVNQKYNYYYILNLDPRLQIIAVINFHQIGI